jgi:competence protein ComEC
VLVVVTADPGAVTAVGAWLSAAAIAGIGWVAALVPERWRRLPPVQLVAVSIGATLFTAPITAFTFGSVALAGVITNLVAVPLSALAVPALVVSLFVGMPAAAGAGLALAGIEGAAELGSRVPGGAVTGTAGVGFALPWLGLLIGAVWLGRLGPAKTRVLLPRLAVAAAGCWAVSAIPAVTAVLHRRAGGLVLYVLDVGQGDAIAIRTPRDRWVLVDGGPRTAIRDAGRTVVAPFLRRMGVKRLEAVVLSHGDADHLGGVPAVLDAIGTDLVLEPGQPLTSNLYLEFQRAVETSGIHWMAARAGDTLVVDSVRLIVLHPTATWMASQFEPNENSVVLHLSYGCFDALLTGDAGVPVERLIGLRAGDVDLLKVGHHGSAGSTSEDWLDVVRPEYAVISVGTNTYGHPAPAVLERLARHEAAVWRTDREGTVTVRTDGRYLWVGEGAGSSWWEAMRCRIRPLSRSNGSSWSRSACTRRPPATSPICSTTSPSPPR